VRRHRRSWWGPWWGPRFSTDVRHGDRGRCCARAASVERGQGNRIGLGDGCPRWGRRATALTRFLMASPLSIGIELQPAGVDHLWVRLWLLDRSAAPSARCQLVVRSAAMRRARELQVAHGAGRCGGCERPAKAHQVTQVWGRGAVGRCCADRAAVGSGQALPKGIADHRSGSGPFEYSRWNPFQRL
jgi:hypothetical protein